MSKLTGSEIMKQRGLGNIVIEPFNDTNVGPNGYDVTLSKVLLKVLGRLDMRLPCRFDRYIIPPEGIVINPGELWLGATNEACGSDHYVPMFEGRSSTGRLGLEWDICAGCGDIGFTQPWTLEIRATLPTRIYADVRVAQIMFETVEGEISISYKNTGKYNDQFGPQPSLMWKDFLK